MKIRTIITICCSTAFLWACTNQSLETTYSNQESRIDSFINSQPDELRVVHNNGSNRVVLTEGEGDELSANGSVTFYYAGYTFSGSNPSANTCFATNRQETAGDYGWSLSEADYNPLTVSLSDSEALVPGLRDGLLGVKNGEECYVVFSGKYGFGDKVVGMIPANSALLYHIWVIGVSN